YAQPGEIGESFDLQIELRLLADAGLIGFPSVGKSTFLSVVTRARPQIADYPFTTIDPNIGVVTLPDERSFVLADMPGLIEGAADGKGLGHEFLRHIRRCRVLIHLIDMSGWERDPVEDYRIINEELRQYDEELASRPQIVAANKMDTDESEEMIVKFREAYPDLEVFEISTLTKTGIDAVLYRAMAEIEAAREKEKEEEPKEEVVVYRYEPKRPDFEIINLGNHRWKVESAKVDRLAEQVNFDNDDDTYAFARTLAKMGVDAALRKAGCVSGDQVIVGTYIMDFTD
ncbi:MAG: Obg family GTPase CgtA, partial [Solobacterium sp.]|nr:Obg family GTPase CgtA [Solobacterium sp.]